eukprot:UN4843
MGSPHPQEAAQRRVEVGEADPSTVMAMACFMYTGKVAVQNDGLIPLLSLADRYDVQPLALACATRLTSADELTVDNVVGVVRAMRSFIAKDGFREVWKDLCAKVHKDPDMYGAVMEHL